MKITRGNIVNWKPLLIKKKNKKQSDKMKDGCERVLWMQSRDPLQLSFPREVAQDDDDILHR